MELDTASPTDDSFLAHPSKRLPAPKFTNNLNNRVTQKQLFIDYHSHRAKHLTDI